MAYRCALCPNNTIFFIWSSSRRFNRVKLLDIVKDKSEVMKRKILNESYPVCLPCAYKLGLIK